MTTNVERLAKIDLQESRGVITAWEAIVERALLGAIRFGKTDWSTTVNAVKAFHEFDCYGRCSTPNEFVCDWADVWVKRDDEMRNAARYFDMENDLDEIEIWL